MIMEPYCGMVSVLVVFIEDLLSLGVIGILALVREKYGQAAMMQ